MQLESTCLASMPLEIRMTPSKGRGVFAARQFMEGELIERAPVIFVPKEQWKHLEKTVFYDYLFAWGDFSSDDTALVLGYGSVYNHSYSPAAYYVKDYEEMVVNFYALRPIEPGEEITINYNRIPDCTDPLWFEVSN